MASCLVFRRITSEKTVCLALSSARGRHGARGGHAKYGHEREKCDGDIRMAVRSRHSLPSGAIPPPWRPAPHLATLPPPRREISRDATLTTSPFPTRRCSGTDVYDAADGLHRRGVRGVRRRGGEQVRAHHDTREVQGARRAPAHGLSLRDGHLGRPVLRGHPAQRARGPQRVRPRVYPDRRRLPPVQVHDGPTQRRPHERGPGGAQQRQGSRAQRSSHRHSGVAEPRYPRWTRHRRRARIRSHHTRPTSSRGARPPRGPRHGRRRLPPRRRGAGVEGFQGATRARRTRAASAGSVSGVRGGCAGSHGDARERRAGRSGSRRNGERRRRR